MRAVESLFNSLANPSSSVVDEERCSFRVDRRGERSFRVIRSLPARRVLTLGLLLRLLPSSDSGDSIAKLEVRLTSAFDLAGGLKMLLGRTTLGDKDSLEPLLAVAPVSGRERSGLVEAGCRGGSLDTGLLLSLPWLSLKGSRSSEALTVVPAVAQSEGVSVTARDRHGEEWTEDAVYSLD